MVHESKSKKIWSPHLIIIAILPHYKQLSNLNYRKVTMATKLVKSSQYSPWHQERCKKKTLSVSDNQDLMQLKFVLYSCTFLWMQVRTFTLFSGNILNKFIKENNTCQPKYICMKTYVPLLPSNHTSSLSSSVWYKVVQHVNDMDNQREEKN